MKKMLQNRTVALLATAKHVFSQWSNVTFPWCMQVCTEKELLELQMICTVI